LAALDVASRQNQDMRLAVAAEYDALGDARMAADVLSRGPQDTQSYSLRASLLAKADDTAALQQLTNNCSAILPGPIRNDACSSARPPNT
jgi:thioredoxin-like negative regulator of GroEL